MIRCRKNNNALILVGNRNEKSDLKQSRTRQTQEVISGLVEAGYIKIIKTDKTDENIKQALEKANKEIKENDKKNHCNC